MGRPRSELIPQCELDDTGVGRCLDLSESLIDQISIGLSESRMIQRIEEFRPKLELAEFFADSEALDQRKIHVEPARAAEQVARGAAVLAGLIRHEGRRVEVLLNE